MAISHCSYLLKTIKTYKTMKKILLSVFAVAALASCIQNETINPKTPIGFGDAYVQNSTKAIYDDAGDITGFTVWGNFTDIDDTIALYGDSGATVTRDGAALGAAWTCSETRFWAPSSTYNFVAIANGTGTEVENGIPTKISYAINTADDADLIYGKKTAETDETATPIEGVNTAKVVNFTMNHLLSRIKLSFVNKVEGGDYTFDVKDVTVTTWANGVYTIDGETWAQDGANTAVLTFDGATNLAYNTPSAASAHLVIPNSTVTISFTYVEKLNGTEYLEVPVSETLTTTLVKNYSYNVLVELSKDNEIKFTVDDTNGLVDYVEGGNVTVQ